MKWYKRWKKKRERRKKLIARDELLSAGLPPQLNVIQGVAEAGKSPRNLARIATCEAVMADMRARGWDRIKPELYRPWAAEHRRRMKRYHDNDGRTN